MPHLFHSNVNRNEVVVVREQFIIPRPRNEVGEILFALLHVLIPQAQFFMTSQRSLVSQRSSC